VSDSLQIVGVETGDQKERSHPVREDTKKRKKATRILRATQEQEWWANQVVQVMLGGKRALDAAMLEIGRMVAETIM